MSYLRLGLALSGWCALAATALPGGSPLRVIIAFAFLLVCPGAAVLLQSRFDRLEAFVLMIALSLAIGALVAEMFFLTRTYTTTRALVVLAVITTLGALWPRGGRGVHALR